LPPLSHLTSCTPTKSKLYLGNSQAAARRKPDLCRLPTLQTPKLISLFHCLDRTKVTSSGLRLTVWMLRNRIRFYSEELLAPRPTPKLEDHPLSAVCDCLFNIFVATFHIGGHSSIHNLRTHHAVVIGTHLSCILYKVLKIKSVTLELHKIGGYLWDIN
jgi:hypothetical protein